MFICFMCVQDLNREVDMICIHICIYMVYLYLFIVYLVSHVKKYSLYDFACYDGCCMCLLCLILQLQTTSCLLTVDGESHKFRLKKTNK